MYSVMKWLPESCDDERLSAQPHKIAKGLKIRIKKIDKVKFM